ncbi:hypothetical protein KIPB_010193, partial [Kipferlia bialata]|eukprot:g10193.t1
MEHKQSAGFRRIRKCHNAAVSGCGGYAAVPEDGALVVIDM